MTSATQELLAEAKAKRDLLSVALAAADELDDRIDTPIHSKFSCQEDQETGGPLTADETKKAELFWEKRVQVRATADGRYRDDLLQLNLQPN